MLLNVVTEKAYIGQTIVPLRRRWAHHKKAARKKTSNSPLKIAIAQWNDDSFWELIELEKCHNAEELNAAETRWIALCDTCNSAIGYNAMPGGQYQPGGVERFREWGRLGGKKSAEMTPEELERFREYGKRGAGHRGPNKREISEEEREEFRAWGRIGAEVSKARARAAKAQNGAKSPEKILNSQ